MNNNAATNELLKPDEKQARRYFWEYGAQVLLGSLFLLLVCYTGTLVAAFSGQPHLIALIATCAVLTGLCLCPSGEQRRAPRFVVLFWTKFEKLPTNLLLPLAAWLVCGALATLSSSIRSLSYETYGMQLWLLLIAALIYSYAGRGILQILRMAGAMLIAIDVAIVFGISQFIMFWFTPAPTNWYEPVHAAVFSFMNDGNCFGHFLAMTLPLALWDTARAHAALSRPPRHRHHVHPGLTMVRRCWPVWRIARSGLMIALSAAAASRSGWLGLLVALFFFGYLLAQRQKTLYSQTHIDLRQLTRPYRASLILGAVLVCGIALSQTAWYRHRLAATVAPADFGSQGRGAIWRNTLRLAAKRPAFGWGPGTLAVNYPQAFRRTDVREAVLQAHNTYLNRFVEEGLLALVFWLVFVVGIWKRGLRFYLRRPDTPQLAQKEKLEMVESWKIEKGYSLLPVFLSGLLGYGVAGIFVVSEQIPTTMVFFYGFLAMILALVFNDDFRAFRRPGSAASPLARGLALAGGLSFVLYAPTLWRTLQAQIIFDDALSSTSPVERVWKLRQARNLDPNQPVYWGQLGLARFAAEGKPAARSIANLFRAAANRSPSDAVWWHNTGMLYLLAGDSTSAIRNELRATKYDGTNSFFQATLADAYELDGQTVAAAARRQRAREFNAPPITQAHQAGEVDETAYFCRVIGARYRRVVTECEIIRPKDYTREDALNGTDNMKFYAPGNPAP